MMNHDHYQILGIGSTATQGEIKKAYRRLVKIHHPDVSRDPRAAEKTRLINAAYHVLSDPTKRLAYDYQLRRNGDSGSPESEVASAWIYCQGCGLTNETLRVVAFYAVVGFLLGMWRTVRGGVLCSDCRSRVAFRQNVITTIFGWWGVPSFFYAWHALLKNLTGGVQPKELNAELREFTNRHKALWASQVLVARTRRSTRVVRTAIPLTLCFGAMALLCSLTGGSTSQANLPKAASSQASLSARSFQNESRILKSVQARIEADTRRLESQIEQLDSLDADIEDLRTVYEYSDVTESQVAQFNEIVEDRNARYLSLMLQASALKKREDAFNARVAAFNERLMAARAK